MAAQTGDTTGPGGPAVAAREAHRLATLTEQLVQVQEAAPTEPVGLLHLERLEMTPVGVEHGELVHSVPLTPKESVNITHREWSVTTQTFESLVTDSLEGFSETGVVEKTDLAQSTDTEASHSSALDVNGSVSATYNGGAYSVTASAAVASHQSDEAKSAVKNSVAHSVAITRQASTRTRKEHQVSFRVSSVTGAENLAVRVLTNPSDKDSLRVDYYQLLRKWRVDLIRYGLRMTYDLVIPNPGIDLINQVIELQKLEEELSTAAFSFTLSPDAITIKNYQQLGVQYGVALDPPPEDTTPQIPIAIQLQHQSDDVPTEGNFTIDIPDGYKLGAGWVAGWVSNTGGREVFLTVFDKDAQPVNNSNQNKATGYIDLVADEHLQGQWGKIVVRYKYTNIDTGQILGNYRGLVKDQTMTAWRLKCWAALREAAQNAFDRQQALANNRKAFLQEKIGQFDALTLRKMEREEIMKWTLQWLLGPKVSPVGTDVPAIPLMQPDVVALYQRDETDEGADAEETPDLEDLPDVDSLSAQDVTAVLGDGELIKFLHNAIEWENTLFFVYPYFWDATDNWPFKKFLVHPDPIHREFLRSGACRVVLTIRPGFEEDFAWLVTTGSYTGNLPQKPPYVTIGEETRNKALTNYENIPPANPDHNVRMLLYPPQQMAWADMEKIMAALTAYFDQHQTYPAKLSDLHGPLPPTDPWGRAYHYVFPGENTAYDLVTFGKNGQPGGEQLDPLNADISNWAEGSIVGRWYEYTPTSAMDVAVTVIPPATYKLPAPEPA